MKSRIVRTACANAKMIGIVTMTKNLIRLSLAAVFGLIFAEAKASCLEPAAAQDHIGEATCVCGTVASAKYASSSNSQPTFLNLDRAYPEQIFTVVIFGKDRSKFGAPEIAYSGKRICATGRIETYKGRAEIIVNDPSQLK
jgi:DNA/RNA endonuclease YhcR with UshA esterase domain